MSKRRYSVNTTASAATHDGPGIETIEQAQEFLVDTIRHTRSGLQWRIYDHSTTPPTDVTNTKPKAEKVENPWVRYVKHGITSKGAAYFVGNDASGVSDTPPTDGSPYYRVTVERIEPEPEQPQWHYRNSYGWQHADPFRKHVFFDAFDESGQVWGTTKDRDAKFNTLLESGRAAGKGGEE